MYWIKTLLLLIATLYLLGGVFLYLFQEKLVFLPEVLEPDFVYSFDAQFDEVNLEMEDGAVLNALHFKAENAKGIILYFHGNAGNLDRWGDVVLPFLDYGYDVLIVDYRGYGKSTGKRTKQKMLTDAESVYAYIANQRSQEQIIVYGRSLGSAFATHVGRQFSPAQVILESPFYSVADVASGLAWMYPVKMIMRFNFQNWSKQEMNVPVTIFHGTDDTVVPYESGKKLHESIKGSALVTVKNAGHNDLSDFQEYWRVIDQKLK